MAIHKKAENSLIKMPVEVLNKPKNWDLFKLPNMIKQASIEKTTIDLNDFDLKAEVTKHPEHLFLKIFAIKKDEINDNGDAFSAKELQKAASTFVGVPLFTNHQNDDIEKAKGDCVHSWFDKEAGGIFIIGRVDKVAYPQLARGIEEGFITGTSMGCTVEASLCSICHNQANIATDYCDHVANRKNRKFSGDLDCQYHNSPTDLEDECPICGSTKDSLIKLSHEKIQVYEHNFGLKFIENSFVVNPACHDCGISEILHVPNVTKKIAEIREFIMKVAENVDNSPEGSNKLTKVAGQQEINMLKESMDNVEGVVKSMLQQKEQISMEYVSDLVKAMSDIQEVVDELVEMGYTKLASPDGTEAGISTTPQPEIQPEMQPQQAQLTQTPQPSSAPGVSSEELSGLGSVTKPKLSQKNINKKEDFFKISSNLIDSINELKSVMGKMTIQNNDKELKSTMAINDKNTKTAASDANQEVITEKQLAKKEESLHPRTEEVYEGITESKEQIGGSEKMKDVTSDSPQVRQGTYETITEDQLASITSGCVCRAGDFPEVITEKQWTDMSNLVSSKLSEDWNSVITEAQLKDLLSNHQFVGPYEVITEGQLNDIGMKGQERWANTAYTKNIIKIAKEVVSDAITNYKKSPEELNKVAKLFNNDNNIKTKIAFISVLNSLPHKREEIDNTVKNINYFKTASTTNIDSLDALSLSVANNANHGILISDVLDSVYHVLESKKAMAQVDYLVQTKLASINPEVISKESALSQAIKELDKPEDGLYQVHATFEDIGVKLAENNKKEFLTAVNKFAQCQIEDEVETVLLEISIDPEKGIVVSTHKDESMMGEEDYESIGDIGLGDILEGPVEDVIDIEENNEEKDMSYMLAEKRDAIVKEAQMMGGEMGGQGGVSQAPGAGASMPQAPQMEQAPMESLTEGDEFAEEGMEEEGDLPPLPPGTACPVCTSKDVNVIGGGAKCGNCGSEFTFKVLLDVTKWADLTPADGEEGAEEDMETEDMGLGEGFEMPEEQEMPAVAAMTRLHPDALQKIASSNIQIGTVSPLTGTTNTINLENGTHICLDTGSKYKVSFVADTTDAKKIYAQWEWTPLSGKKVCTSCQRSKNNFVKALSSVNITEAQFDNFDISEKAKVILAMKNTGALNQVKLADKNSSITEEYKLAYSGYGSKFPIESCIEKLARRYGQDSVALSGPCEGSSLPECVCNRLKKADVYTDKLAIKVASVWADKCGTEECVEDQIRSGHSIRESATICESLKTVLAQEEDLFADELTSMEPEEEMMVDSPEIIEDTIDEDPFEEASEGTITIDLPLSVIEEIDSAIDQAQGENTLDEPHHTEDLPDENAELSLDGGVAESIDEVADETLDGAIDEARENEVEPSGEGEIIEINEENSDMKSMESCSGMEEPKSMKDEIADAVVEKLRGNEENSENSEKKEGNLSDPGETYKEGEEPENETEEENDMDSEYNTKEASHMRGGANKVGEITMDLSHVLEVVQAQSKEITQLNVQDVSEIKPYTNGEDGSKIGHENETIPSASNPSVPRDKALIGEEDTDLNPQDKPLPKIPSSDATIGKEKEVGLSGGDKSFTGGENGAGKASTASIVEQAVSIKEAQNKKLEAPKPVADDKDIQPIKDNKTIGKEDKFDAKEPEGVKGSGNESAIGHETKTVGDRPDSPKDHPDIATGNAQMGKEELDSEKTTKDKGTVIAKSNTESKEAKFEEATKLAGKMLEAKIITASELPSKINEFGSYEISTIKNIEKAMFSKKGLNTVSEGLSQPLIINEASNQRNGDEELVGKLETLFSLGKKNQEALKIDDFDLKRANGRI